LIASEKPESSNKTFRWLLRICKRNKNRFFLAKAKERKSEIDFASDLINENYPSTHWRLSGSDKKTVLQTIKILQDKKLFQSKTELKMVF